MLHSLPVNFILLVHIYYCCCQEFEFSDTQARIKQGKETLEKFSNNAKYKNSICWQSALLLVDSSCRKMSDIHQSYLALQFANCHLEKSGLETYPCEIEDFKECTNKMGSNIIAFNSYTQFFTHVSDICFYYQSEIWRERTESTIQKLSKTSEESLEAISKSVQQQKEVISSQEQSLQNQKDIIKNENLLKETLLTSAKSAKDVFNEVRVHAQQQKTMFSETFDSIFQSVEKLSNLQKMLLGEFIGLQSVAFYFVATIVCYLFTSTPQTSGARLLLFGSLTILIFLERVFVGWKVNTNDQNITSTDIHERIWVLRKIFLVVGTVILGVFIIRYKDFNKINYCMLQDIQLQVSELRKIQQNQSVKADTDTSDGTLNATLVPEKESERRLSEAAKQLELSIKSFVTSTPQKCKQNSIHVMYGNPLQNKEDTNKKEVSKPVKLKKQYSLAEFSDEEDYENFIRPKPKTKSVAKRNAQKSVNNTLNDSKYNLRSRGESTLATTVLEQTIKQKTIKTKKGKQSTNKKPAFFSSDEEN